MMCVRGTDKKTHTATANDGVPFSVASAGYCVERKAASSALTCSKA